MTKHFSNIKGSNLSELCSAIGVNFNDDSDKHFNSNDLVKLKCSVCGEYIRLRKRTIVEHYNNGTVYQHRDASTSVKTRFKHFIKDCEDYDKWGGDYSSVSMKRFDEVIGYPFYERFRSMQRADREGRLTSDQAKQLATLKPRKEYKKHVDGRSDEEIVAAIKEKYPSNAGISLSTTEPEFGHWIRHARERYRKGLLKKNIETSLREFGFDLDLKPNKKMSIEDRLEVYKAFIKEHGEHPKKATEKRLYGWACDIRKRFKNEKLNVSDDVLNKLIEIGVINS